MRAGVRIIGRVGLVLDEMIVVEAAAIIGFLAEALIGLLGDVVNVVVAEVLGVAIAPLPVFLKGTAGVHQAIERVVLIIML